MAKCPNCGADMHYMNKPSMKYDSGFMSVYVCPNCNNEYKSDYIDKNQYNTVSQKQKSSPIIKYGGGFIVVITIIAFLLPNKNSSSNKELSPTQSTIVTEDVTNSTLQETKKPTENPIPKMSEEDFKKSCKVFNYKTIARNPDQHIGENFKLTVQVFDTTSPSWYEDYNACYKVYTDDGTETYYDHLIYIMDHQDSDSKSYLKVLDGDIITFYGTFNGMIEEKNYITNKKSEEVGLDIYYAELVSE